MSFEQELFSFLVPFVSCPGCRISRQHAHAHHCCYSPMSHNLWTPSPDGVRWKIFPNISRHPLCIDFESPEDAVIVGYLSESQYRKLKPHRSMSDDSEREKAFANGLRSKEMKPSGKKKKGDNGASVTGGANRSVGPCAAMGSMCGHTNLENNRHSCSVCGHCMHIIGPWCSQFDLETDVQVCGKCEYHMEIRKFLTLMTTMRRKRGGDGPLRC
jgi:hypothetical protein